MKNINLSKSQNIIKKNKKLIKNKLTITKNNIPESHVTSPRPSISEFFKTPLLFKSNEFIKSYFSPKPKKKIKKVVNTRTIKEIVLVNPNELSDKMISKEEKEDLHNLLNSSILSNFKEKEKEKNRKFIYSNNYQKYVYKNTNNNNNNKILSTSSLLHKKFHTRIHSLQEENKFKNFHDVIYAHSKMNTNTNNPSSSVINSPNNNISLYKYNNSNDYANINTQPNNNKLYNKQFNGKFPSKAENNNRDDVCKMLVFHSQYNNSNISNMSKNYHLSDIDKNIISPEPEKGINAYDVGRNDFSPSSIAKTSPYEIDVNINSSSKNENNKVSRVLSDKNINNINNNYNLTENINSITDLTKNNNDNNDNNDDNNKIEQKHVKYINISENFPKKKLLPAIKIKNLKINQSIKKNKSNNITLNSNNNNTNTNNNNANTTMSNMNLSGAKTSNNNLPYLLDDLYSHKLHRRHSDYDIPPIFHDFYGETFNESSSSLLILNCLFNLQAYNIFVVVQGKGKNGSSIASTVRECIKIYLEDNLNYNVKSNIMNFFPTLKEIENYITKNDYLFIKNLFKYANHEIKEKYPIYNNSKEYISLDSESETINIDDYNNNKLYSVCLLFIIDKVGIYVNKGNKVLFCAVNKVVKNDVDNLVSVNYNSFIKIKNAVNNTESIFEFDDDVEIKKIIFDDNTKFLVICSELGYRFTTISNVTKLLLRDYHCNLYDDDYYKNDQKVTFLVAKANEIYQYGNNMFKSYYNINDDEENDNNNNNSSKNISFSLIVIQC